MVTSDEGVGAWGAWSLMGDRLHDDDEDKEDSNWR
jgi:hypothetical protein